MIIADKSRTKITGMNIYIIYEFNSIIRAIQQTNPEIALGVITAWSTVLVEKLDDVSKTELSIVTQMSENYIKLYNESEDNNA